MEGGVVRYEVLEGGGVIGEGNGVVGEENGCGADVGEEGDVVFEGEEGLGGVVRECVIILVVDDSQHE